MSGWTVIGFIIVAMHLNSPALAFFAVFVGILADSPKQHMTKVLRELARRLERDK